MMSPSASTSGDEAAGFGQVISPSSFPPSLHSNLVAILSLLTLIKQTQISSVRRLIRLR